MSLIIGNRPMKRSTDYPLELRPVMGFEDDYPAGFVDPFHSHDRAQLSYANSGMTPTEVLHAATIGGARTIGGGAEFGSIEAGKYADLVILDADPRADIRNARRIAQVMKNGRLYDGATLDEIWPRARPHEAPWFAER